MPKGLVETITGRKQWIMRVDVINNVGIAIININKPPIFYGLYHPSMVIRGMVYYCYTNISVQTSLNWIFLTPSNAVAMKDFPVPRFDSLKSLCEYSKIPHCLRREDTLRTRVVSVGEFLPSNKLKRLWEMDNLCIYQNQNDYHYLPLIMLIFHSKKTTVIVYQRVTQS